MRLWLLIRYSILSMLTRCMFERYFGIAKQIIAVMPTRTAQLKHMLALEFCCNLLSMILSAYNPSSKRTEL